MEEEIEDKNKPNSHLNLKTIMKKILLTFVALVAMSMSVCAQEGPTLWHGGPGKKYVDRSTLKERAMNYHFIINDKSSDVYLAKYKGGKCWFGGATGKDNMGYYDESITYSEKEIIEKEGIPTRSSYDPFNVSTGKKKKKNKK
jgi:hypothetical protein